MRTFGVIVAVCAALLGAGYLFVFHYLFNYPTYTYRYRLNIEVESGGQLRTGSSVIQVRTVLQRTFGSAPPVVHYVTGEAVFIDLGEGRNLIAILASGPNGSDVDYPKYLIGMLFGLSGANKTALASYESLEGARDIPADRLPTLVSFSDLNDPKFVRVVKPRELEGVFGADVHFKRAWAEITKAPVTRTIEQKMPLILMQLREGAKTMQVKMFGGPFIPALGNFYIGD